MRIPPSNPVNLKLVIGDSGKITVNITFNRGDNDESNCR